MPPIIWGDISASSLVSVRLGVKLLLILAGVELG
jgi:hypothetical protein